MSSSSGRNPTFSCQQLVMEILLWMIKIWMKNHLVSDCNPPKNLQGMTNNVGLTFRVGDTTPWFTRSIEQDN